MTDIAQRRGDDIGVHVEGVEWPARIDGEPPVVLVVRAVGAALAVAGPTCPVEAGVLLTGADEIRAMNRQYRHKDAPTNVLAFAAADAGDTPDTEAVARDGALPLGDIVIAGDVCRDEAVAQGKRLADHLAHLAVHGTLHLLGYDHEDDTEAEVMEALERDILAGMGVADPYGSTVAA